MNEDAAALETVAPSSSGSHTHITAGTLNAAAAEPGEPAEPYQQQKHQKPQNQQHGATRRS